MDQQEHSLHEDGGEDANTRIHHDPLNLHDYMMSDAKTPRIESLIHPSPSPSIASISSPRITSTGFLDYPTSGPNGFPSPFITQQQQQQHSQTKSATSAFTPLPNAGSTPAILPPIDPQAHLLNFNGDSGGAQYGTSGTRISSHGNTGMNALADASDLVSSADRHNDLARSRKLTERGKLELTPAWTEMKTKAGKERKRLPLACIACRRKKIRCSGEKPACKHCLRSRIPCVYKVTTRKAAPRTDYMAMLDKRLKRMEDRVIKLIPKESQSIVPRAVVRPALPTLPSKAMSRKRAADEAFGGDPDLDRWAKTRQPSKVGDIVGAIKGSDAEEKGLLSEGEDALPSKEIQEHLAEVYFDFVYGQSYPLLHKPSFMARLAAGNVAPVLVLAVCAISARFSNHPHIRTEPAFLRGEEWASAARDIALRRWDTPNLTILIVYLLLGLHEFGTCHGGRSWMLAGMAQRMAFALLLHQDLDHNGWGKRAVQKDMSEISPTDREIRRRTMWSCFLMDRFNASGTDRPMQMSEDFLNIPLPVKEQFFRMELAAPTENLKGKVLNPAEEDAGQMTDARENMGTSAYYIKLVAIWGRLVRYWNLGGREKEKYPIWSEESQLHAQKRQMDDFEDNLPEHMQWNPENLENHASEKTANQFVFLHLMYYQIRLFINRWALPNSGCGRLDKDIPKSFIIESARAAIDAANSVSALIKEAHDHNVTAPFAGYAAFYSSTVHVQGVFSMDSRTQETAKQNLAHNVKYLTKMKKYWGMFHFIAESLKELYRKHADAVLRGKPDAKGKPDSIIQYGDWFDKYPRGVSETDYEDPASVTKTEPGADTVLGQSSDLQSVEEFFAALSPISKAAQLRKQARKSKAKAAAERDAANNITSGVANASDSASQQQGAQDFLLNFVGRPVDIDGGINGTGLSGIGMPLNNNNNPLIQQTPMMSQVDRHMVLSSYAGMDPASAASISNSMVGQQMPLNEEGIGDDQVGYPSDASNFDMWNLDNMGFGGFGSSNNDASTAWFMPFNLDPPTYSPGDGYGTSIMLGDSSANFDFLGQGLMSEGLPLDTQMLDAGEQAQ